MNQRAGHPDLLAAVSLSHRVVAAADGGDMTTLAHLDAERLQLLKSFRSVSPQVGQDDRSLLREINELNERALGLMEHQRRIAARAFDVATIGRRAVHAYANNRPRR
jgi:hypothetical protein